MVVYGGTSGGVAAAVQAARMGRSVVLIEPGRHLGGLTSGGLGATDIGNAESIGGMAREFYQRVKQYYANTAAWTFEKREEYRSHRHRPDDDVMWTFEPHVAEKIFNDLVAEAGVRVIFGERLDLKQGVRKAGNPARPDSDAGRIAHITGIVMESGREFRARVFIDATYEGDLMAKAGVSYHVGREANAVYGETINGLQTKRVPYGGHNFFRPVDPFVIPGDPASDLLFGVTKQPAGEEGSADQRVQAYCFRLCLTDVPENRVPFSQPDGYDPARYELLRRYLLTEGTDQFFPDHPAPKAIENPGLGYNPFTVIMPNRKTDSNSKGAISFNHVGGNYDYPDGDYATRERIIGEHERWQQGLLWFLQNDPRVPAAYREPLQHWGLAKDEFTDHDHWPHQLYVREARRMIGEYVMTEQDCAGTRQAEDSVGLGSYGMDSHVTQRYVDAHGWVRNEGNLGGRVPQPYPISYRALTPKRAECDNLLVPVCCSASHVGYSSIRMEPVYMILGQSAGAAAALAVEAGAAVQAVEYPQLRAQLVAHGQRLAWPPPAAAQVSIPAVEQMPAVPEPFQIIDWKARARGFDRLAFDENAEGEFLPLVRNSPSATPGGFVMPAYVGMPGNDSQAITALAALVSGGLFPADPARHGGRDWASLGEAWCSPRHGIVLNDRRGRGGLSFWYDVFPGVLFCQFAAQHPEKMQPIVRTMADRWREAVEHLGGATADFNHTAFSFGNMAAADNGKWTEPDAAAGLAWIEFMAWTQSHDPRHLEAARWCLDSLERRPASAGSPLYEVLLYYAPALAARWNAEHGGHYDVRKLVEWCLSANAEEGVPRRHWGILHGRFGAYGVDGLQGSTRAGDEYAFAMNTFQAAAALAPLARYDDRYARTLGKWLLHVANNARLFYPDALPAELQQSPGWTASAGSVVPYEGLRHHAFVPSFPKGVVSSSPTEQVWEFAPPADVASGRLQLTAWGEVPPVSFAVSIAPDPSGPWNRLLLFPHKNSPEGDHSPHGARVENLQGWARLLVKLEPMTPLPLTSLTVQEVRWVFETPRAPFAMGDAPLQRSAPTGLAVYGGAHAGYLAALVEPTNEPHILQLDLLATDWFHGPAYPTYLYYNPDGESRRVRIDAGAEPRDLYDAVSGRFLACGLKGEGEFQLAADTAAVVVLAPAGRILSREGSQTLIDGVVVDRF